MLAVNYFGGVSFGILIGVAALVAELEMTRLLRAGGYHPVLALALPAAVAFAVLPLARNRPEEAWVGIGVLLVTVSAARYLLPPVRSGIIPDWTATVAGSLYIGLLLGHLSLLRQVGRGAWWVVLVLVVTWAYDTGAYASGQIWGRRPFMPHISPKKTIEGVIGGLVLASLSGLAAIWMVHLTWWQGLVFGVLGGAIAQIGDLTESMLKRQVGVKDSGSIMPGHGGLLDRIDSLLLTGVFGYYAAALLGHGT